MRHFILLLLFIPNLLCAQRASNPLIFADVPDMSMIRVGNNYYMSSTTMHMSPGVPIMKSTDLVNWTLIGYAYDTLADMDALNLVNGKNSYGNGSWASSLRYHNGVYYLTTFAQNTGRTHIYSTTDIEKGNWTTHSFAPSLHDHSLFFDDDGKVYMIWGAGKLRIAELDPQLKGFKKEGQSQVLIENASAPAGTNIGLNAEGSQLFKINGWYYLFNIVWPRGGMRTVLIHRSKNILGPYEGKVALQDRGIAQGGLIDMPDGRWFSYQFRDYGAVGRIPYLVPVKWENDWPVLGVDGKVPDNLELPLNTGLIPGIVASDEFNRKKGEPALPLVWQWNHNPDNRLWSVTKRKGWLRLTTGRIDTSLLSARNMLTQRTFGPTSSASTLLDLSAMREGDRAGLCLLQKQYGYIGIKKSGGLLQLIMVNTENGQEVEHPVLRLNKKKIWLRADCDFRNMTDTARFYYSTDGKNWNPAGVPLQMKYTLPHFMGYRFGLFCYATEEVGGYIDVDWLRLQD
jgi:beta-xylosidase